MKKILIFTLFSLILVSCEKKNAFTVEGIITGGNDKMLYLEHVGQAEIRLLDSVRINSSGVYTLNSPRPDYPDFYRLRLKNQSIHFAIDSTETITINSDTLGFAANYTVEGSEACSRIRQLALLQIQSNQSYQSLKKEQNELPEDEYVERLREIVDNYKTPAKEIILQASNSTSAYFALFQQIDNMMLFDPYQKEDNRFFAAVATGWDVAYPDAGRSRMLRNLTISSRNTINRQNQPIQYKETSVIDAFRIILPDISGNSISLSDVVPGKITLLDFTVYQAQGSAGHNNLLIPVYEKYKDKGFHIYQVSLDEDEHYWKNVAYNLPWITVRDQHASYSEIAATYNVRQLPTTFLIDRSGEIVKRIEDYSQLEKEVASSLK